MSEASVEIWKGRDQFGPLKIGVVDNFSFKVSKAIWQLSSQQNSTPFVSNYNIGPAIFVKLSINRQ